jgi:hypothetical protein
MDVRKNSAQSPAFPNTNINLKEGIEVWGDSGMSVRHYFAIRIFIELMKNGDTEFNEDCEEAYRLADKLIKAGNA